MEERKEALRELLRRLHAGASPAEVKENFKKVLEGVSPLEIARVEQELVQEGFPREEIRRLCEVHLEVFREQLERQRVEVPPGNPLEILVGKHEELQKRMGKVKEGVSRIAEAGGPPSAEGELSTMLKLSEELLEAEKHYLREENVLFPMLEKHGITEPPAIMWMEHDQLRREKKELHGLLQEGPAMDFGEFKKRLEERVLSLDRLLQGHILKENRILFPSALRVITPEEWREVRRGFDEIGYCCFTPPLSPVPAEEGKVEEKEVDLLQFETGSLSEREVEAILNTLPVDLTFVGEDDTVRYFNKPEKRFFVRTKAVLGRKVQLCHPQKSVHVVNRILEAFKRGERDVAEFWIQKDGRLIYIRYFAVRDREGKYLGTLEVTQDITELKRIEGERRLLDWGG
ncbi:MAG: DUF438 domain-containing protein [Hadesarchaea archaeon]|nr:MAG: DUF438 domain-containing protein [Hadesarchaea archaeon]